MTRGPQRSDAGKRIGSDIMKRPIVDAHYHLWDPQAEAYPWLDGPPYPASVAGDVAAIAKPYLIEDYLADSSSFDVRKTVHVEAGCQDLVAETAFVSEQADKAGISTAIVAGAELQDPEFPRKLERQSRFPQLRGVRQVLNWDPNPHFTFTDRSDYMEDAQWLRGFRLLRRYDLSFDLQVYPWQLEGAAQLAKQFPDTLMILNHAGMPLHQHGIGMQSWRSGLRTFAACDNAAVKISGLGMMNWNWTTDSIRPYALETIEIFGVNRCMFASNFPVDRLYSPFDRLFRAFEQIVGEFSETEQVKLFSSNAERLYRF